MSDAVLDRPIAAVGLFARRYLGDLSRLGIKTFRDALMYFPFRYDDLSNIKKIAELKNGEPVTFRAMVKSISGFRSPKKRMLILEALVSDETGNVLLTWFNQRHLLKIIKSGDEIMVSGIPERGARGLRLISPAWEPLKNSQTHVGRIVPVYSVTGSLTPKALRAVINPVLAHARALDGLLSNEIITSHGLIPRPEMVSILHYPDSWPRLRLAERTRDFEQLFLMSLSNFFLRAEMRRHRARAVPFFEVETKEFVSSLPYQLTADQRRSAWEIIKDIGREEPMNRLLDGDVGSGKTTVAAIAAFNAARAGAESAFLVPTSVLARQHFTTLSRMFSSSDYSVVLVTSDQCLLSQAGKTNEVDRAAALSAIASGAAQIIVGTHALLEERVSFHDLRLTVVDEQHRFGVAQRKILRQKAGSTEMPHLLSMTATPIPRTLALAAFGDLDISVIRQKPIGRLPVETTVVAREKNAVIASAIKEAVTRDGQAFFVCPRIAEDGESDRRSVTAAERELRSLLPEIKTAVLHGKMKSREKEAVMAAFLDKQYDLLVSTTVIEVGVDVSNATLMIIDGAESFGLAQLHQLRGRVGRGSKAGKCLLIPRNAAPESFARLKLMERCHDGFKLAEADLEARGPGELIGTTQSGFFGLTYAALRNDELQSAAKKEAEQLMNTDPGLEKFPALKKWVCERTNSVQLS
jgi:ATP-dependent DNA helicase RecG